MKPNNGLYLSRLDVYDPVTMSAKQNKGDTEKYSRNDNKNGAKKDAFKFISKQQYNL